MPSLRLCSHIKTNGQKCGSPALRHHTMCYFHYQWQRRDQRRIRLGGPIGMGKNSGIELPLLDGPEAILLSIMETQRGLLDQRIPVKMGTALLYSLQLALQAKISPFGLGHSSSVRECPELDYELELERAKGMRPAKEKCAACPKRDDCLSPRGCKKLPKVPGYHRVGDRLVRDRSELDNDGPFPTQPQTRHSERRSRTVFRAPLSARSRPQSRDLHLSRPKPRPLNLPCHSPRSKPRPSTPPRLSKPAHPRSEKVAPSVSSGKAAENSRRVARMRDARSTQAQSRNPHLILRFLRSSVLRLLLN